MIRLLLNVSKYLLALGLLGYVINSNWLPGNENGLEAVWQKHVVEGKPIHLLFLFASIFLFFLGVCGTIIRWHLMMLAQDMGIGFWNTMRIGFIGFFFNTLLPGSVGGDLVKAAAVCKNQSRRSVAVTIILLDRAIALWGLIFFSGATGAIFLLAGYLGEGNGAAATKSIIKITLSFCGITGLGWFVLGWLPQWRVDRFEGRLRKWVAGPAAEFWLTFWRYRCKPLVVMQSLLISWTGHVCLTLSFYCAAQVLRDDQSIPNLLEHFLIVPLGLVIQATPMFPGGAGIGEFGFGALYSWFGTDRAMGVLASLVQRLVTWIIGISAYLVIIALPVPKNQAVTETSDTPS